VGKRGTWLACGGAAAGACGAARRADRALGTGPALCSVAVLASGLYLAGTFRHSFPLFGRVLRARAVGGAFALTFDDGPDPRFTPRISSYLASRGHRATFFVLGRHVAAHPEIAAQVVADGHELANHGRDHRLLAFSPPAEVRDQIAFTEAAVRAATGRLPAPLFRAPHGVRSPWLTPTLHRLGYRLCGWDGRVFDTAGPGSGVIAERVVRVLRPGTVVLLHDGDGSGRDGSREQTVEALAAILDAAEARGLRSVPLSVLAS
jgi:peptidoglycan/xylan/chitin deacetylase (PgdA/CDA1 family)